MFVLLKLILNFFSVDPKLPLIPQVGPSPSTKKLFLQLSAWEDGLLSTTKIATFLAKSLSKSHEPRLSNVIPYPLYIHFYLSLLFTILVAPNKQFLNLKLLVGFLGQASKSKTMEKFTILVV